jgi:hypothetical protein
MTVMTPSRLTYRDFEVFWSDLSLEEAGSKMVGMSTGTLCDHAMEAL